MPAAQAQDKNPGRVAAGLKAAMHNPNLSDESKRSAQDRLEHLTASKEVEPGARTHHHGEPEVTSAGHETNRVLGGYKATLHNEHASGEAKQHAREVLAASGYTLERGEGVSQDEHESRVLAGYKAALHNPRVSDAAKQHAREYLTEHNAL